MCWVEYKVNGFDLNGWCWLMFCYLVEELNIVGFVV